MNVLLTHGYFLYEDEKEKEIMRPYPPLGILYIAAWLEREGISNAVFDTTFSSKQALFEALRENPPGALGIYVNLMTKLNVLDIITFAKEHCPGTHIFVGGPDVRYNAEALLRHGAHYVVIGEGEETTQELVQALEAGQEDMSTISGLAYIDSDGAYRENAERTKIRDINDLPFPAREKINIQAYFDAWREHHGESAMTVSTMRGCPYTCKWCSRAVYGLSYRRRSPELVADELAMIQEHFAPDMLWFVDDVFTVNPRWMREFKEALDARQLSVRYECITRADRMNEEMIQLLKDTGCARVWIGAESGSQKVIDLMDRRVKVEQVRDMIQRAQEEGIQAGTFIMLGYPGETEEDIHETVHHLKVSNPDHFTITVAYPIRGTELYEETEELQTKSPDWSVSTDRDIDFERSYPRHYYPYAVAYVIAEVNYHKAKLAGQWLRAARLRLRSLRAQLMMAWVRSRHPQQQPPAASAMTSMEPAT